MLPNLWAFDNESFSQHLDMCPFPCFTNDEARYMIIIFWIKMISNWMSNLPRENKHFQKDFLRREPKNFFVRVGEKQTFWLLVTVAILSYFFTWLLRPAITTAFVTLLSWTDSSALLARCNHTLFLILNKFPTVKMGLFGKDTKTTPKDQVKFYFNSLKAYFYPNKKCVLLGQRMDF